MKINHINKKSDFKLLVNLSNYTSGDFRLTFFTNKSDSKKVVCSFIDGVYTNCSKVDNTHYLCSFNNNSFYEGILIVKEEYSMADESQPDGVFTVDGEHIVEAKYQKHGSTTYEDVNCHIEITNDEQDSVETAEATFELLGTVLQGNPTEIKVSGKICKRENGIVDLGDVEGTIKDVLDNKFFGINETKNCKITTTGTGHYDLHLAEFILSKGIEYTFKFTRTDSFTLTYPLYIVLKNQSDTSSAYTGLFTAQINADKTTTEKKFTPTEDMQVYVGAGNSDNQQVTFTTTVTSIGKLDCKVDKEVGKGLSTNDYSNVEKAKVGQIEGLGDKIGDVVVTKTTETRTDDISSQFTDTCHTTPDIGSETSESTPTSYKGILITNLTLGDKYSYHGRGGVTCRAWAKVKNGKITERQDPSETQTEIDKEITVDGTFDSIIFNMFNNGTCTLKHTYTRNFVNGSLKEQVDSLKKPLSGKKLMVFGDSAVAASTDWVKKMANALGLDYRVFAIGGYTWLNQFSEDGKTYKTCMKILVDSAELSGYTPDIILTQIGGNDYWKSSTQLGTLESAFANANYKTLASSQTIYEGIRYNLCRLKELYPNAIIVVGTNWQCRNADRDVIATAIKEVAYKLALPVIDGNKYSGISAYGELPYSSTYINVKEPSREDAQFVYLDNDGNVTTEVTTNKKYGDYTYDGTHLTLKGENHIAGFMTSQLYTYIKNVFAVGYDE